MTSKVTILFIPSNLKFNNLYGRSIYDKVLIEDIIGTYIPIADLLMPGEKMSHSILKKFRILKIGGLKLISTQEGIQLAKTLRDGQGSKLTNFKTSIPFMQKRANRSFIMPGTADTTTILTIDNVEDIQENGAGEGTRTIRLAAPRKPTTLARYSQLQLYPALP